ncbi:uncharacterized protein LOC108697507 [Xenopus laevis]|uniref:Uncharacterized protein LOC108697507 n=1 Tax=Xenopus laevis TaxID=8355 RepID=A0A8J1LBY5_XENLA|nr:uncharacterized protein LOC108697507 [Xenopus laevis]
MLVSRSSPPQNARRLRSAQTAPAPSVTQHTGARSTRHTAVTQQQVAPVCSSADSSPAHMSGSNNSGVGGFPTAMQAFHHAAALPTTHSTPLSHATLAGRGSASRGADTRIRNSPTSGHRNRGERPPRDTRGRRGSRVQSPVPSCSSAWESPRPYSPSSSSRGSSEDRQGSKRRRTHQGSNRFHSSCRDDTTSLQRSRDAATPLPSRSVAEIPGFSPRGGVPRTGVPNNLMGDSGAQLMNMVRTSVAPATWAAHGHLRATVWMVGHSYIRRAEQRAAFRPGGDTLGFTGVQFQWRGIGGLRWLQILPEVVAISRVTPPPVILVIHAGGNDLGRVRVAELLSLIRSDVGRFNAFFSDMVLVWSEIVPRLCWRGARDPGAIERARRLLNSRISRFVRDRGGIVVRHRLLEGIDQGLMLRDGVHLNDIGLDIFLAGLQDGIGAALVRLGGGRSPV